VGAWLPWALVQEVCRLDLRPSSRWRVFLAVLLTAARYGGHEAHLTVAGLAGMTGLSARTVKAAVADLIARGLLVRTARYSRLRVTLASDQPQGGGASMVAPPATPARGANLDAPPRGKLVCTSPTSFYSLVIRDKSKGPFTDSQRNLIADALTEATELLGDDIGLLPLPDHHARRLGLPPSTTYGEAIATTLAGDSPVRARDLTRAVLALRHDPRVQGDELTP
jgi:hypothetical protein